MRSSEGFAVFISHIFKWRHRNTLHQPKTYLCAWMMALKAKPSLQLEVKSLSLTTSSYLETIAAWSGQLLKAWLLASVKEFYENSYYVVYSRFYGHRPRGTSCNEVSPILSSKPEQQQRDQTTTPGTTFPILCEGCVGSLTSPAITI